MRSVCRVTGFETDFTWESSVVTKSLSSTKRYRYSAFLQAALMVIMMFS